MKIETFQETQREAGMVETCAGRGMQLAVLGLACVSIPSRLAVVTFWSHHKQETIMLFQA
jgi:hypothetical protein